LSAANIDSYYSLVGAGYHVPPLDTMHVSNEFNHVILCVPFNSDTIWLECTSGQTPFGYFLDLKMDAPGFSLARVFKSF